MSKRARMGDVSKTVEFANEPSLQEVWHAIDDILAEDEAIEAFGIEVSNSIDRSGIGRDYRGRPVAPADDLYPTPAVRVLFRPRSGHS